MQTYDIVVNEWNWIRMCGSDVVDISVGDDCGYAGCRCSACGEERYNPIQHVIVCHSKDSCCNSVLGKLKNDTEPGGRNSAFPEMLNEQLSSDNEGLKEDIHRLQIDMLFLKSENEKLNQKIKEANENREKWENRYYRLQSEMIKEKQIQIETDGERKRFIKQTLDELHIQLVEER